MSAHKPHSGVNRSGREVFWERMWAGLLVIYSIGSAYIVWRTLGKYGVNPFVFLIIDMVTSWPYGLATARIVVNVVRRRWREARKWGWVAAITFIAPYVYVLGWAHHAPSDVYYILILVITALVLLAVLSIVLQIRSWGKLALSRSSTVTGNL